jgi:hypothetical protein
MLKEFEVLISVHGSFDDFAGQHATGCEETGGGETSSANYFSALDSAFTFLGTAETPARSFVILRSFVKKA